MVKETKLNNQNQSKDPFDEIIEILQEYDEGFERDPKTDYEF